MSIRGARETLHKRMHAGAIGIVDIQLRLGHGGGQHVGPVEQQCDDVSGQRQRPTSHLIEQRLQCMRDTLDCAIAHRGGHALDRVCAAKQRCDVLVRRRAAALFERQQRGVQLRQMFAGFDAEEIRVPGMVHR